ncbi:hypothetical protein NXW89_19360 [Bacteroides thetaiotaomicron]|nr:hypothetical protein [Bacteroides thetaiotaomicron]
MPESGQGFQLFDWEMHKDVGNLHFLKYGNTDSQGVCGCMEQTITRK